MSVEADFAVLAGLMLCCAIFGMVRYGTALNPLTVFAILSTGLITLLSAVVVYTLGLYEDEVLSRTARVSMLYLLGATLPFLFRGPYPARAFGFLVRLLRLNSEATARRFSVGRLLVLLGGALLAFALLALLGGGGPLWLTNPRLAYTSFRAGVGPFWLMTQWFLAFAWLYYLWSRRPSGLALTISLFAFGFLAYFTGSKNNILTLGIIALLYYQFFVRRLGLITLLVLGLLGFSAILGLLVAQGSYGDIFLALGYFEYFGTTANFLAHFHEFGYHYGRAWLSSLWFLVPRGLYPDKPYEYGLTLIHRVLFPGAAAAGHTPGVLPWSLAYLDFGAVGVLVAGAITGMWKRMSYEYFLANRQQFFAFVFMIHFSVWPVMAYATITIVLAWSLAQAFFFRLVWTKLGPKGEAYPSG